MIFNWSFGTAFAAALTIASLCVIAAGLETTRREHRALRELRQRAESLRAELTRAAERGVLDQLLQLLSETGDPSAV
jgi:hypothetical protein